MEVAPLACMDTYREKMQSSWLFSLNWMRVESTWRGILPVTLFDQRRARHLHFVEMGIFNTEGKGRVSLELISIPTPTYPTSQA